MSFIHGIITTTALSLAAGAFVSCRCALAASNNGCEVNGLPSTPVHDAELEQSSRSQLNELQASASRCKDVRLVIDWTWELDDRLQGTEVPLSQDEKTELLRLILKLQSVKADLDADITEAYGLDLVFIMPDGSTKTYPYPDVARLSEVRADGYASMCYFALPDADVERWNKLAKHEWVWKRIKQELKR